MSIKAKIMFSIFVTGLVTLFFSTMFAEKGFLDLLRLQENRELLRIENSKTGLKLYASIEHYRRLAKDDPELIEQIAREQGMIGKDELVLIPREPILQKQKSLSDPADTFRILTDEEFEYLLSFDFKSLKFYDELIETD